MKIDIKLDHNAIRAIENAARQAAVTAMEKLQKDLEDSETMPFDSGVMQNGGTYTSTNLTISGNEVVDLTDSDSIHVALTNDAPQSSRLYYNPQYQFQQGHNDNAGGLWLEPYINGDKKDFVQTEFTKVFKEKSGI